MQISIHDSFAATSSLIHVITVILAESTYHIVVVATTSINVLMFVSVVPLWILFLFHYLLDPSRDLGLEFPPFNLFHHIIE